MFFEPVCISENKVCHVVFTKCNHFLYKSKVSDYDIVEIKKDEANYIFYVTVQIQTFEGAHNPPYGEDTITFRIKGNEISSFDYAHLNTT